MHIPCLPILECESFCQLETDLLKFLAQMKDERHPQECLELVDRKVGEVPPLHPSSDVER